MSTPHMNRYFHWCAGCWDWVCDCTHCVEPLNMKRRPVKDVQIRSVGYDRRRGRLEIEFTWTDDVRQFYPVWSKNSKLEVGKHDHFSIGFFVHDFKPRVSFMSDHDAL